MIGATMERMVNVSPWQEKTKQSSAEAAHRENLSSAERTGCG